MPSEDDDPCSGCKFYKKVKKQGLAEARTELGIEYIEDEGLDQVKDLPEHKIEALRNLIADNFDDKDGFIERAANLDIDLNRLNVIYDTEVHVASQIGELEFARSTGAKTKTWVASYERGLCEFCQSMDDITIPINEAFSNGEQTAHGHPNCRCITTFKY